MKSKAILALALGLFLAVTIAGQKTEINDRRAGAMLLGRHKLSLQWISWDRFGIATVTNRAGLYYLKGEQKVVEILNLLRSSAESRL